MPDGYNAVVSEMPVELRCLIPNYTFSSMWIINGTIEYEEESLEARGIFNSTCNTTEQYDPQYIFICIKQLTQNNNTKFQCIAQFSSPSFNLTSEEVIFKVQGQIKNLPLCPIESHYPLCVYMYVGLLDAPTDLSIVNHNSTHQILRWIAPSTLDLTASGDDITGYLVIVVMESPPPHYPYNLSVSIEDLPSTSNQTWTLPGTSTQFPFPQYSFPVWLIVRAKNPAGLGAPSLPLKYSPPTSPDSCSRLRGDVVCMSAQLIKFYIHHNSSDEVSDVHLETRVKFTDSEKSPSVEIQLYEINSNSEVCMHLCCLLIT